MTIETQNGNLINYDHVIAIFADSNHIKARISTESIDKKNVLLGSYNVDYIREVLRQIKSAIATDTKVFKMPPENIAPENDMIVDLLEESFL